MLNDHNRWRGIYDESYETPATREQQNRNTAALIVALGLLVNMILWLWWSGRVDAGVIGGFFA